MYRHSLRSVLLAALAAVSVAACPSGGGNKAATKPIAPADDHDVAAKPASARLVLSIVLDQLPSSAVLRFAPHLPEDGIIRRAIANGMFQERVRYGYAGTNTAPGHASIYTGELPADHGIDRNDIYTTESGRMQIVNDGEHAVFGVEGSFASPFRLLKPTVGDLLHKKSPESKVVSVSLKARAAVVSGGKTPTFVGWYDPNLAGFTTSEFYADSMPDWLTAWNTKNPMKERLQTWTAESPALYKELFGADDAPGESDWHGLGTTFPHDTANTAKPNKTFVATPQSMEYLLEMVRTTVAQYQLGEDAHPDLLMVSVSTTDYAGHSFGASSWEYLDVLIKTDRALGVLVRELEATTDLAVLITSDHGGTPLAELSVAQGQPGGRLYGDVMINGLEAAASKALGKGPWFETYIQPYLYLSEAAKKSGKLSELYAIIDAYALEAPALRAVYPANVARTLRDSDDWLERDVAQTVSQRAEALFVVPAEWHVGSSTQGTLGTGHGTPWDPDREVPVLAVGAGVSKARDTSVLAQDRVAPTIAALLNLSWHLAPKPLSGAPKANAK